MNLLKNDMKELIENGKLIIEEYGISREMTDKEALDFLKFKMWLNGGCTINETSVRFEYGDE